MITILKKSNASLKYHIVLLYHTELRQTNLYKKIQSLEGSFKAGAAVVECGAVNFRDIASRTALREFSHRHVRNSDQTSSAQVNCK